MSQEMYVVVSLDLIKQGQWAGRTIPSFTDCAPSVLTNLDEAREWLADAPPSNEWTEVDPKIYRLVEVTE